MNTTFVNDEYFEYISNNKRNLIASKCLDASGFTNYEIDNDPYINGLSKIVNNLYLYTIPLEDCDNVCKFLTWD